MFKIILLALTAVVVGLVELIVGGILPSIATDLQIPISAAGQMITIFALVYAISGPVLISFTVKIERKKLYLLTLGIFVIGNLMTFFSTSFLFVMIARVITAMSAALIISLSLSMATRMVPPSQRAKAVGYIYMGVSSALVLGVPFGVLITSKFGWRTVFLIISILSFVAMLCIAFFLEKMPSQKTQSIPSQLKALANKKIIAAHLATMFMLAGHYTVYAYFTPFLETTLQLSANWISIFYFIFGIAAVSGTAFGGWLGTTFGSQKSILSILVAFTLSIIALPYAVFSIPLFLVVMISWAALSWSLAPPQQDYIVQTDPNAADLHQSINNSALQVGIALGSGVGGSVLKFTNDVTSTTTVGAGLVVIAFLCAFISLTMPTKKHENILSKQY